MNYENTGEMGVEMNNKAVEHGTEVPPNAVSTNPVKAGLDCRAARRAGHCSQRQHRPGYSCIATCVERRDSRGAPAKPSPV